MYKKSWILLGALILIILSVTFFYFNRGTTGQVIQTEEEIEPDVLTVETPEPESPIVETPEPTPQIKEFDIIAKRFEFIPETITVNQGDRVRLTITSIDVTHGFFIGQYGINERLEPGKTKIVEFTADKKGEFSMICNVVCGSGHSSMRGKLIVN